MSWQQFREEEVWTLDVDDLFKENKKYTANIAQFLQNYRARQFR